MTDSTPSPLARLIAQWREHAAQLPKLYDSSDRALLRADAFHQCADELEAALRDSESATQGTKENEDLARVEPPARLRR